MTIGRLATYSTSWREHRLRLQPTYRGVERKDRPKLMHDGIGIVRVIVSNDVGCPEPVVAVAVAGDIVVVISPATYDTRVTEATRTICATTSNVTVLVSILATACVS